MDQLSKWKYLHLQPHPFTSSKVKKKQLLKHRIYKYINSAQQAELVNIQHTTELTKCDLSNSIASAVLSQITLFCGLFPQAQETLRDVAQVYKTGKQIEVGLFVR